jgi:branched-chain amino acid transport system ATP-binding protein
MLEIRNLAKSFGGVKATNDVSLDFPDGSLTAVIGPNGAGKSTFFNILSGALTPTSGKLHFRGRELNGLPQHRFVHQGISRSYQITNIFPDLSVHENVRVAAQALTVRYDIWRNRARLTELHARADAALDAVGLLGKRGELAKFLSHGQQRALEIAIALVSEPELLLLDEPTAGMGTEERWRMIDKVRELWERERITVVFIEHDMDIVFKIAPAIVVLCYGRILATGTPDAIRHNEAVIEAYLGTEHHAGAAV